MIARTILILLASTGRTFAHDAPALHVHPHGDWTLAAIALLMAGAAAIAMAWPQIRARKHKGDRHDPR